MRKGITEFILLISITVILMLFSGCSGVKSFYTAGNTGSFASLYPELVNGKKSLSSTFYRYVPTSCGCIGESYNKMNLKNGKWRFSISYPASMKLEF